MTDNYDYIHQASNERLAEMIEDITNLWSYHPRAELLVLVEAARRLRIPQHQTFHEEYMGEV